MSVSWPAMALQHCRVSCCAVLDPILPERKVPAPVSKRRVFNKCDTFLGSTVLDSVLFFLVVVCMQVIVAVKGFQIRGPCQGHGSECRDSYVFNFSTSAAWVIHSYKHWSDCT